MPEWLRQRIEEARHYVINHPSLPSGREIVLDNGIHVHKSSSGALFFVSPPLIKRLIREHAETHFPEHRRFIKNIDERTLPSVEEKGIETYLRDIHDSFSRKSIFHDLVERRAKNAGISVIPIDFGSPYASFSQMLLVFPSEKEREKRNELFPLYRIQDYDVSLMQLGTLGHFTVGHSVVQVNGRKIPVLLVSSIHQRKAFYSLPNKQKRAFDRWYDGVLDYIEEVAARNGLGVAIIRGKTAKESVREWINVSQSVIHQFYERFPERRGYSKTKGNLSTAYSKEGFELWIKTHEELKEELEHRMKR